MEYHEPKCSPSHLRWPRHSTVFPLVLPSMICIPLLLPPHPAEPVLDAAAAAAAAAAVMAKLKMFASKGRPPDHW